MQTLVVAEAAGRIVGWCTNGECRDEGWSGRGEVAGLYAAPDAWSMGVGHALIVDAEQRLRDAGFEDACLWALTGNERAMRFYERHGWREDGGTKTDHWGLVDRRRVRVLAEQVAER